MGVDVFEILTEPKEGLCPAVSPDEIYECSSDAKTECFADYNCDGDMKCCQDGCNSVCVGPSTAVIEPEVTGKSLFHCLLYGSYSTDPPPLSKTSPTPHP